MFYLSAQKTNKFIGQYSEKTKNDFTNISNNIRFKSSTKEDSDENNDILINSVVTDVKKA